MGCKCQTQTNALSEDHHNFRETDNDDPSIVAYKDALKQLGVAVKSAHKTEDGKKLSAEYWTGVVSLLKKAKLGVSMMELGIDDEEEIENTHDTTAKKVKPTPAGEKGEGGPRDGDSEESKNESINEKSSSKSQQRLFGMVHAYNKGDLKKADVDADLYAKIKKIANGMTKADAEDMAKTDHDDLPEKVPTDEFYDVMNHLGILLSEASFDSVECEGTEFSVEVDGRKHTIEYDDKFFLVSDEYKFELGDRTDISEVVDTFTKLSRRTFEELKDDYKHELVS